MAESNPFLIGFVDRELGEPAFSITLSDAAAMILVSGSVVEHFESLHPMLGSLSEYVDPDRLRPYVLASHKEPVSEEAMDQVVKVLMRPLEWMRGHTAERLDLVIRDEGVLKFVLMLPEAYWLGATVDALGGMFRPGSAQHTLLFDMGEALADLFTPAELMMGWRIENQKDGPVH